MKSYPATIQSLIASGKVLEVGTPDGYGVEVYAYHPTEEPVLIAVIYGDEYRQEASDGFGDFWHQAIKEDLRDNVARFNRLQYQVVNTYPGIKRPQASVFPAV